MMKFETSTDAVSVSSDNGDAVVPGTKAVAAAKKEAKATGKPVTIRNAVTDKVLATVKPETERRTPQQAAANLKAAKAATKAAKAAKAKEAKTMKAKAVKKPAAKKAVAKKVVAKKSNGGKPVGMTGELVKLALREKGVTPAQLNDHSKWKGAPWKWFFSNPKKTGVADRFGFKLKVERDGRAVTYFLTAK